MMCSSPGSERGQRMIFARGVSTEDVFAFMIANQKTGDRRSRRRGFPRMQTRRSASVTIGTLGQADCPQTTAAPLPKRCRPRLRLRAITSDGRG